MTSVARPRRLPFPLVSLLRSLIGADIQAWLEDVRGDETARRSAATIRRNASSNLHGESRLSSLLKLTLPETSRFLRAFFSPALAIREWRTSKPHTDPEGRAFSHSPTR